MQLKPLFNNVIVKPAKSEEMTKSGIVLPDTGDKEKPEKGEVIAVGSGKVLENGTTAPMTVKVGNQVMFKKYSPDEVKIDGEDYLVLSESDIVAIIE
ncbi:co-chaperone GroES [Candidatus Falkowbacteria bacterium]|uniref:Co-chaperonin GroES n=1 Tax=Candidatus Falkowbacteria bacterium CG10_big_fil_rev_8_21_14_0_10_37_18 TaxID=1974562 RepID=A0A2H0V927_9BACT|nr:co-chaperone GroES [Candidatus Falkowbacteria bacterium]NCQ12730.1 co-chaperone GroES [Candidatus Falkowbacteria bacterium]PIR95598.1 MAG: co-chaperone GroES [Candidatus Falkowbacteria bacterium CG10_big_fil_rev_8_21_14_0_10_37_18]